MYANVLIFLKVWIKSILTWLSRPLPCKVFVSYENVLSRNEVQIRHLVLGSSNYGRDNLISFFTVKTARQFTTE